MNRTWTVIKFTYLTRFRSKSFRVMSLILIVLLSVLIHLPTIMEKLASHEATRIGVFAGKQGEVAEKLATFYNTQQNPDIVIVPLQDAGSAAANEVIAKKQIAEKAIKGYLEFTDTAVAGFPKTVYKSEGTMEFSLKNKLQTALQLVKTDVVLQGAGIAPEQKPTCKPPSPWKLCRFL